jgi:hypothetical protein
MEGRVKGRGEKGGREGGEKEIYHAFSCLDLGRSAYL